MMHNIFANSICATRNDSGNCISFLIKVIQFCKLDSVAECW